MLPAPEDMRGMTVRDRHGLIAGRVAELFVDADDGALLYLGVAAGPGIAGMVLVPLDEVFATSDPLDVELVVPYTRAEVRAAPVCADGALPTVGLEIAVRRHFARAGARSGADVPASGGPGGGDHEAVRAVRWGV
ncbi:MAG: PRC-barrel domain-containing protein [Thermoleophilia bacterium]